MDPEMREVDRVAESWANAPTRRMLSLLWDDVQLVSGVKVVSYWDTDPWCSPYVIYLTQPRGRWRRSWRSWMEADFYYTDWSFFARDGQSIVIERESSGATLEVAREMVHSQAVVESESLCEWIITLGHFREKADLDRLLGFAGHPDPVVRYATLGVLSWSPSLTTENLEQTFSGDADSEVTGLLRGFSSGKIERWTDWDFQERH